MDRSREVTVSSFEAILREVVLPFGLIVDVVKISGESGSVARKPFHVQLDKPGRVLVSLGEANLQNFLEEKSPAGLHDFEIKLEGGKLNVAATAKVVIEVRANAICSLEIRGGKELWVVLESVQMLGVGAKGLVERQLEKLNPVLDLSDFPLDVTLEKVSVSEGEILVSGTLVAL